MSKRICVPMLLMLGTAGCANPTQPTTTKLCVDVVSVYTDMGIVHTPTMMSVELVPTGATLLPTSECQKGTK